MTANCSHDDCVENHGELVCRTCGLVLETQLFEEESWRAPPPVYDFLWTRTMKKVLCRLGYADAAELAGTFRRPAGLSAKGSRLSVVTTAYLYVQWPGMLSEEHALAATGASRREWSKALSLLGARSSEALEEEALVFREARKRSLPECIPEAVLRVLEETKFESCAPLNLLIALTTETLGEDVAASLFEEPVSQIRRISSRYQLREYAPNLSRSAEMLQKKVAKCECTSQETLVTHVQSCSSCSHYVEHNCLGFLLRV
jgi:hypothetical protein